MLKSTFYASNFALLSWYMYQKKTGSTEFVQGGSP